MNQTSRTTSSSTSHRQPLAIENVEYVFDVMLARYGREFIDMWKPVGSMQSVKREWANELAGYTKAELEYGLEHLPAGWPPDAPKFAALCRPPLDYEQLFHKAVAQMSRRHLGEDNDWPNVVVFWAAAAIGPELMHHPYPVLKNRWIAAIRAAAEDVREGRRDSKIPRSDLLAIAAPGKSKTSCEVAKRNLAEALAILKKPHA